MSKLARDPVFGEVARRLRARGDREPGIEDPPFLVAANFRAGVIDESGRRVLESHGIAILDYGSSTAPWREEYVSEFDRTKFEAAAKSSEYAAAILAASDHAGAPLTVPRLLGVVNVTPDSFSDGGLRLEGQRAIDHGVRLVEEGADLLDVGGESTRPRSEPVSLDEELRRVVPVVEGLARRVDVPISVDTTKGGVARAALDAGATIVNDVSAGRFDPAILDVAASRGAGFVAMHMRGEPRTMQEDPRYTDVVVEVLEHLRERCAVALDAGIPRAKLWIDPGIGFGKSLEHNLELLRSLHQLRSLGLPIVLGVSRKSFIAKVTGRDTPPADRVGGSAAAVALGVLRGAEILRVHDVAIMREAALVARAIGVPS